MNVGGKQRQVRIIAAVQRQLHDRLGADHLAVIAGIGFEHLGRANHAHRLGHLADLELRIHPLPGGDIHFHIRRGELREAGMLHGDGVASHLYVEEAVIAGSHR